MSWARVDGYVALTLAAAMADLKELELVMHDLRHAICTGKDGVRYDVNDARRIAGRLHRNLGDLRYAVNADAERPTLARLARGDAAAGAGELERGAA